MSKKEEEDKAFIRGLLEIHLESFKKMKARIEKYHDENCVTFETESGYERNWCRKDLYLQLVEVMKPELQYDSFSELTVKFICSDCKVQDHDKCNGCDCQHRKRRILRVVS